MKNNKPTLLQSRLREFAKERDWEQFHSPKNLSMALIVEAAELVEHFQWMSENDSREVNDSNPVMPKIKEELADVFLYLLRLADVLGVDLEAVANEKLELNAKKYPVELSKGNAIKYNKRQT
jgi:dCTP diphosphatase